MLGQGKIPLLYKSSQMLTQVSQGPLKPKLKVVAKCAILHGVVDSLPPMRTEVALDSDTLMYLCRSTRRPRGTRKVDICKGGGSLNF